MNKAVLHDHLDGGLRAITAKELAIKDSYKPLLDVEDIESFFNRESSESLEDYLDAFTHTTALMSSYENLERIAFEAAEDMHFSGISLYESRYAPLYSVSSDLSAEDVINAINSGFKQAENLYGIKSGLILCGMRNDKKNVTLVSEIAIEFKDKIIGFDIAGPEYNFLPSLFSSEFDNLKKKCIEKADELKIDLEFFQSNIEGDIVGNIQEARKNFDGMIINAGGYTHTSVAIRDALGIFKKPIIELHLSNIYKREEFRHKSLISDIVTGGIFGLSDQGYILAIIAMQKILKNENK